MKHILVLLMIVVCSSAAPAANDIGKDEEMGSSLGILEKIPGLSQLVMKLQPIIHEKIVINDSSLEILEKIPGLSQLVTKLQPIIHEKIMINGSSLEILESHHEGQEITTAMMNGLVVDLKSQLKLQQMEIFPAKKQDFDDLFQFVRECDDLARFSADRSTDDPRFIALIKEKIREYGRDAVFNARVNHLTCFNMMAWSGFRKIVYFFIREGVDVNQIFTSFFSISGDLDEDRDYSGPTIMAANPSVFDLLVNAGADINARMEHNLTPLHMNILTADAHAWPDKKGQKGPLKSINRIEALIKFGADLEARTADGETPLRMVIRCSDAVHRNCVDQSQAFHMIVLLLKNGASLENAKKSTYKQDDFDESMENPRIKRAIAKGLHLAARKCDAEWVSIYLNGCEDYEELKYCTKDGDYGPNWNRYFKFEDCTDNSGRTALVCPQCGCKEDEWIYP